jgi:hypothetical protein
MTFHSLSPGKSPLSGSQSPPAEEHFVPQSRETGEVLAGNSPQNARSVTKAEPVAKPWAHFVAGGYGVLPPRLLILLTSPQPWWYDRCNLDLPS